VTVLLRPRRERYRQLRRYVIAAVHSQRIHPEPDSEGALDHGPLVLGVREPAPISRA
jgi:hypothetical protein